MRSPLRIFDNSVHSAKQIVSESLKPYAVPIQEVFIVQPLLHQRMSKREQDRGVTVGPRRQPLGIEKRGGIVAHGTDIVEFDASRLSLGQPTSGRMLTDPAGRYLRVPERD